MAVLVSTNSIATVRGGRGVRRLTAGYALRLGLLLGLLFALLLPAPAFAETAPGGDPSGSEEEPEPSPAPTPLRVEYAPRKPQPILVSWPRYAGEFEPLIFANGGYGLTLAVRPKATPHWRFRAGGYAVHVPRWIVDINQANRDWDVWIRGWTVSAEWFPSRNRGGFFVGAGAGYSRNEYTPPSKNGATWIAHLLAVPVVGYQYFPLSTSNLYLQGSALATVHILSDGVTQVNEEKYDEHVVTPSATFHVGIEF